MATAKEKLELIAFDPNLKNACTEVALIATAEEPTLLLPLDTYAALSKTAQVFIDDYDKDGDGGPIYNFFEDLHIWGVLDYNHDYITRPTSAGLLGHLLVDDYFEDQLGSLFL